MYSSNIQLVNNNGNHMNVILGPTDNQDNTYFILPKSTTKIKLGGTLMINSINQNPAGNYFGNFDITVIHE